MELPYLFLSDLSKLGGSLEPSDLISRIGPNQQAIQILQRPIKDAVGPILNTAIQRDSFIAGLGANQAASTASQNTVQVTFGVGFWDIYCVLSFQQDFTPASPIVTSTRIEFRLISPSGVNADILSLYPGLANWSNHAETRLKIFLDVDGWTINTITPATGVGQTLSWAASIIANRLL